VEIAKEFAILVRMRALDGKYRKRRRIFNDENHAHELTFSCYRKLPLLGRDRTRLWMIDALVAARRQWDFALWAYVLMPDHAHVLLFPRAANYSIEKIGKSIKQSVARRALKWLRLNSPGFLDQLIGATSGERQKYHFWQPGGGYDRNICAAETAWKSVNYLHLNPVRRGLVERPEHWEWSSAGWYSGLKEVRLAMDEFPPEADR
jgi:putative transposase